MARYKAASAGGISQPGRVRLAVRVTSPLLGAGSAAGRGIAAGWTGLALARGCGAAAPVHSG